MKEWFANMIEEMLDFPDILNASIAASWMVLAVLVLRLILKKAPKWTRVALWGLVAIRLLLPFSIESAFSLIPSAQTVPEEVLRYEGIQLKEPVYLDVISNPVISGNVSIELDQTADRLQIYMIHTTFIWLIGIAILFLYTMISYWTLQRKVDTAVLYRGNVFQSENVRSPFVLGIIRPRIYLPFNMGAQDMEHVIAHEQAHLTRKDHWWKPLGFLLLAIHWFNPVMWLAYIVLCRDIELACDEKVIKELGNEQRADYTQALVACSINRRLIAACPLAFGEVGVKERVKSVMNYKKPTFVLILVAVIVCVFLAVCFLTNPKESVIHDIYAHKGYTVLYQQPIELTLSVDKTLLPDAIYTREGCEFEGEVVAYQTDHTTIYLSEVMLSNESDDQLYFVFDCSYNISNYGSLISPFYAKDKKGVVSTYMSLISRDLKDGKNTYPDSLSVRGQGPGEVMIFYVSKDACKAAEEKIEIQIKCNQIFYAREGYTLEWKEGNKAYERNYRYLMHYTGESPTANAAYDTYSRYVLVNDQKVTWEDIQRGMYSSKFGDYIAHDTVYVDLQ